MKEKYRYNIVILFTFLFIAHNILAGNNNNSKSDPKLKAQAKQWMQSQPVQFIENKGQMIDMEGKPVPFVLFKAEAPGVNLFISEKGLTYMFFEMDEEHEKASEDHAIQSHSSLAKKTVLNKIENREKDNVVKWSRIDMELTGASIKKENIITEGKSTNFNQYFLGHCPDGITDVHSYEKVTIKEIYPGIDWVFYNSNKTGFKYDFVVHPGADPNKIKLLYRSEKKLNIDNKGSIQIKSPYGTLSEQAPVSYLEETKENIPTIFAEKKIKSCYPNGNDEGYETEVVFNLEHSNLGSETLIIDPQLVWGTFYGGSGAEGFGNMDCDVNGNLYVTGYVISADFPTQAWGSAYFSGFSGTAWDVFILRFSNTGVLTWATYYGGTNNGNNEMGRSIKIDATGNVFVTGWTSAPNFPTQTGTGSFTGAYYDNTLPLNGIAGFILRFSNTGVRTWATLIDYASFLDMALDINGNIYLAGNAGAGCPLKPWGGAYFDASIGGSGDCYIIRFSNKGILIWATYYGGSILTNNSNGAPEFASNITTDAVGNIYVAGQATTIDFPTQTGIGVFTGAYYDNTQAGATDIFILRFSNKGVRTWATLYGGSIGVWGRDHPSGLRVDVTGNIYVTGVTDASDFPTQSWGSAYFSGYKGASDAFILRFSNTGMRQWATYYGGNQLEDGGQGPTSGDNLEIDNCGNIYISFDTYSSNIPTLNPGCASYFDGSFGGGTGSDQFLVEFNNTGTLLWATYIGGSNNDFRSPLAIDKNNNVFLGGEWTNYASGAGLPTLNPAGGAYFDNTPNGNDDSFIMKLAPVFPTYTKAQVNQSGCSCNGTATVTVNCGKAPFNYVWNNGSQTLTTTSTTNTITSLCTGNYYVIVTDAACIQVPDTVYFTITGSGGLTLTPNQINAGCVNPGTASVTATGGTGPYTYSWSPTGQAAQTATGLSAGNYTVTVTDNTGCISNKLFTIVKDTGNVIISISPTDAGCSAGSKTGNATVNIISGTSPYIFNWSNGQTTQTATGLNASVYTVTVTDNTGCLSIQTIEIINNTGNVSINTTLQNVLCPGDDTGSSTATGTGGTGPYIYSWSNGQTNANATGLKAGTYIVTATDVNGCSNAITIVITEPQFSAMAIQNQTSTCWGTTGKATAFAMPFPPAQSTGPYTYMWSNGQNTVSATGLSAGAYKVTVTNASGCTSTAIAIIGNSNGPNLSVTNNCSSSKVTAFGGALPYTYLWSNGQTAQTAANIKAGDYVIVSDASGCYNVIAPVLNPITVTVTSAAASCGSNNGSAAAGASGINSWPYTYLWNNSQTTQIAANLAAGIYTVTVTGSNGCTETGTVTVASDNCTACSLTAKTNINTNVSCNGGANGSATVLINNGSGGPYNYSWSNGSTGMTNGTSIFVTGLQATTYTVTISEGVCTSTSTVSISSPPPLLGQFTKGTASCVACGCKEWLMINGAGGTSPYSYTWPDGYTNRYKNQLCSGAYSINIKDKNGCSVNVSLTAP